MSRSKSKIAVTLLSALACSAGAYAKLSNRAKIAIGATVLTAGVVEAYNEIAGAISGKKWYSGKYSLANLIHGKNEKDDKNPDDSDEKNEFFTKDEVQKILGNDQPKGEIKSIEDLKKLMLDVTNGLHKSSESKNICNCWAQEIFKKFDYHEDKFEYKKEGNSNFYTYVDKDSQNFENIKKFVAENKMPDIFGTAEKLGKKIVPVFQIKVNKRKNIYIYLYFACEDSVEDYLKGSYLVFDSSFDDLYLNDVD